MQKRTGDKLPVDPVSPYGAPVSREDEVNLVDLWFVIQKSWMWLLAGFLLGIAAAVAYATLTIPVYESRASMRIGKVPVVGLIEDLNALAVQLMDEYGPDLGNNQKMPHLKHAGQEPRGENIIRLVTVGNSPEEARDFLAQIIAKLIKRHQVIYGDAIRPLQHRLAAIDKQVELFSAQMSELGDLVGRLKESNPVQASLVAIERGRVYAELNELERDRVALQQKAIQPYSSPSEVVMRATLPNRPTAPRRIIAIAIGIVCGLLLGLLAIFVKQFRTNVQAVNRSDAG